ncbi:MAG: hypothetical protein AVDCRST_MAG95-3162 [uncultured Adhaeribacter sp.]|uniref:Uncharacterized protein n=1 Tax=uncultured Adhaeribacter sp. TaxID=448109 RepID=A0A6J4JGU6_9BACT|nr:MAG: hypothetical protein AVDCRST_MAG95-3162 [uncultured Adhaeribacter sp.]
MQLWEPAQQDSPREMKASKALSIIAIEEKALSLNPLGLIKIEFGNSQFDTRQMYPISFEAAGDNLMVKLSPDFTQCKAIGRGGSCGTNEQGEECCAPAAETLPVQLLTLNTRAVDCCTPGSGCC